MKPAAPKWGSRFGVVPTQLREALATCFENAAVHPFEYAGELTMEGFPFGGTYVVDERIVFFVMLTTMIGGTPCDPELFLLLTDYTPLERG